jgi:hypothetical protein
LLTTKRGERQIGERERETNREKIIKKKKKDRERSEIYGIIYLQRASPGQIRTIRVRERKLAS